MNAGTVFFLSAWLGFVPLTGGFLAYARRYASERARADDEAGAIAESVSAFVARIHEGNRRLRELEAACAAALLSGPEAVAGVAGSAHAIAALQDLLLASISERAADAASRGTVHWRPSPRGAPGACEVPAPLDLSGGFGDGEVFGFRSALAGFGAESADPFSPPTWHFRHPDALPLR